MYLTKLILSWWQGTIHRLVYGEVLLVRSKIAPMRLTILPDSIEPPLLPLKQSPLFKYFCQLLLPSWIFSILQLFQLIVPQIVDFH
jgi:hypothetical protein